MAPGATSAGTTDILGDMRVGLKLPELLVDILCDLQGHREYHTCDFSVIGFREYKPQTNQIKLEKMCFFTEFNLLQNFLGSSLAPASPLGHVPFKSSKVCFCVILLTSKLGGGIDLKV